MRLDIYVHYPKPEDSSLAEILKITKRMESSMGQAFTDIKALLVKLDETTTAHAALLTALRDQIGVGMTQAEVDEIKAGLTQEIADLENMGKNPSDPVPPPTEPVP